MSVLSSGCVDCAERDPVVLEFDHVGNKTAKVAVLCPWASLKRLEEEISQCVIRCCNCHRLVTHARRGGSWRDSLAWTAFDG